MPDRRPHHQHWLTGVALTVAIWMVMGLTMARAGATQLSSGVRIHRYAAFSEQAISSNGKLKVTSFSHSAQRRMRVSVYGKQLNLNLENNAQLTDGWINHTGGMTILRGTLEGAPDSWVRLTQVASGTYGLIWDGNELYAIEPSAGIRDALAISLPAPNSDTIIFRLSDTTINLGGDYCASAGHPVAAAAGTGLATYQTLIGDLQQPTSNTESSPKLRVEMQILADAAFLAEYSSDQAALDAIMVRLNNVDGIFSAQMGLEVQATDVRLFAQDPSQLSTSTNAETLLNSIGQLRAGAPEMSTYAATHLFTGRDLDGDTLGIAYIGNICSASYAASLSESRNRGAWIDSLVTAHELGHQLGAVHDGTGACADTAAQSYLMSALINGSEELSQCSKDSMFATMQQAACLVPIGPPDLGLVVDQATLSVTANTSLKWELAIQNAGSGTAKSATVHLDVPANLLIEDSSIAGGSCVSSNGTDGGAVDCQLDSLNAYQTRQLAVTLRSGQLGSYVINASAATDHDNNLANNQAQVTVIVADDVVPVGATGNRSAVSTQSATQQGGGGIFDFCWLLIFNAMAGWRLRRLGRRAT
jgi:Metallo-peptidase family M12/Domain of unknown function DUF11